MLKSVHLFKGIEEYLIQPGAARNLINCVTVSANGCPSSCVCPVMNWRLVHSVIRVTRSDELSPESTVPPLGFMEPYGDFQLYCLAVRPHSVT